MADEDIEIGNDKLEVFEKVGSGSTCDVFRGKCNGDLVAIKEMAARGRAVSALRMSKEFTKELAVLKQLRFLRHPNLVHFIGCNLENPRRIICEFCSGGAVHDLLHLSDHIEICWPHRVSMCSQVAEGMAYLHGASPPVMHRDLKSHNLLLYEPVYNEKDTPIVKVADFGLAKMIGVTSDEHPQKHTTNVGTWHWKAPEMMTLDGNYDEKVDVYSFAIVVYEVICRELPFADKQPQAFARDVLDGIRPDPEEAEDGCPQFLKDAMVRCWHPDPAKRPSFSEECAILLAQK